MTIAIALKVGDGDVLGADGASTLSSKSGIRGHLLPGFVPIQDAIDLVEYLVEVTIGFVRFTPGAPTVAPPIDIAAITRHEKFKWIRRKHFYSPDLNPG